MKRKDKMSIDQVLDAIKPAVTTSFDCEKCPAKLYCDESKSEWTCIDIVKGWLDQDVVTKPRYMTFKDEKEMRKAIRNFFDRAKTVNDLIDWLSEEVAE